MASSNSAQSNVSSTYAAISSYSDSVALLPLLELVGERARPSVARARNVGRATTTRQRNATEKHDVATICLRPSWTSEERAAAAASTEAGCSGASSEVIWD